MTWTEEWHVHCFFLACLLKSRPAIDTEPVKKWKVGNRDNITETHKNIPCDKQSCQNVNLLFFKTARVPRLDFGTACSDPLTPGKIHYERTSSANMTSDLGQHIVAALCTGRQVLLLPWVGSRRGLTDWVLAGPRWTLHPTTSCVDPESLRRLSPSLHLLLIEWRRSTELRRAMSLVHWALYTARNARPRASVHEYRAA